MSDVATKAIDANPSRNGWAIAYVDKLGNKQVLAPSIVQSQPDASGLRDMYNDRFDDTTYYTA